MNRDCAGFDKLYSEAIALKNKGEWHAASQIFESIVIKQSDWEHGYGYFNLAQCYEELKQNDDAYSCYERAFNTSPTDRIILGGFASYLFLHGTPKEALDRHLQLIALERKCGDEFGVRQTSIALRYLGLRLGWSEQKIENVINET